MLFVTSLDYNSDIAHFKLEDGKIFDNQINNEILEGTMMFTNSNIAEYVGELMFTIDLY
ncbi:Uncharacterised protein [Staphylococcus aureus]|uniref:Uncharacterized protein n=1 Tax=Staphylococcus aureus TaxID=1280 RepID=A0A380DUL6_STAAU|nr:Uncharacterised protein [Staphylococcus aureus]